MFPKVGTWSGKIWHYHNCVFTFWMAFCNYLKVFDFPFKIDGHCVNIRGHHRDKTLNNSIIQKLQTLGTFAVLWWLGVFGSELLCWSWFGLVLHPFHQPRNLTEVWWTSLLSSFTNRLYKSYIKASWELLVIWWYPDPPDVVIVHKKRVIHDNTTFLEACLQMPRKQIVIVTIHYNEGHFPIIIFALWKSVHLSVQSFQSLKRHHLFFSSQRIWPLQLKVDGWI